MYKKIKILINQVQDEMDKTKLVKFEILKEATYLGQQISFKKKI